MVIVFTMNWKCEKNDTWRSLEEDVVNFEHKLNYGHFENDFKNESFKKRLGIMINIKKYSTVGKFYMLQAFFT